MKRSKQAWKGGSEGTLSITLPNRWLAPHSAVFLVLNLGYFLPVLAIVLVNFSGPGGQESLDVGLDNTVLLQLTYVYLCGVFAFLAGSKLSPLLTTLTARVRVRNKLRRFELNGAFWQLCWFSVGIFIVTKLLLIPRGVYSNYAFSTGMMTGGLWSFSMFCSELLLFLSIVVLFSNTRRNLISFFVLSGVNGINLLHGTRIFFISASIAFGFYLFVRGQLRLRLLIGMAAGLLAVAYSIFLLRSHVALNDNAFSFARIISPIMYESIFSQFSLIGVIQRPALWGQQIFPANFFLDMLWFNVPRFLLPGKGDLLYTARFDYLSPMGAFSGYAEGLLYFGVLFPAFYFILGVTADWILRQARYSQFWSVIYVDFTCDFLFHIMRDGYAIPVKMLADNIMILVLTAYVVSPQLRSYAIGRFKGLRDISTRSLEGA